MAQGGVAQMCEVQGLVRAGAGFSSALGCAVSCAYGCMCTAEISQAVVLSCGLCPVHMGTSLSIDTQTKRNAQTFFKTRQCYVPLLCFHRLLSEL